jgi:hypothetical protein
MTAQRLSERRLELSTLQVPSRQGLHLQDLTDGRHTGLPLLGQDRQITVQLHSEGSVQVSQILSGFASGPAGEIPPGESIVQRCWKPYRRPNCSLPCSAEKLGELGDPGFQVRLFWKRLW